MSEGGPRPLVPGDLGRAAPAIARAFAWHEPWGAWALPEESSRERTLLGLIESDIRERFIPHGECWTIDGACVTLWIPPASAPGGARLGARRSEAEYPLYGERAEAMRAGDALVSAMKPEPEHWYLDTIATEPESMGRGLGGTLLDHDLAIRDARGEACALDTHTRENVGFYSRRGFEVVDRARLPEDGPELFVMFRPARS